MRAFISYSHRDIEALRRLHVHLAVLKREGLIETWFDREILAGDEIDTEIQKQFESADLILLLVSPDFIASDYCVERELARALERHDNEEARVVPIILEPCDWKSLLQLRRLKAVPQDGRPITDWVNSNTAFLDVVQEIRRVIDRQSDLTVKSRGASLQPLKTQGGHPRYRIRRDFDGIDRIDFRNAAFLAIKEHFLRSTSEVNLIDGLRSRFYEKSATSFNCTIINRSRKNGTGHITIHSGDTRHSLGDIYYSLDENGSENTAHGCLNIVADEYEQFLSAENFSGSNSPTRLNALQAAQYLWNIFIAQAGITHD